MNRTGFFSLVFILITAAWIGTASAADYTSSSFIVRDPVIGGIGGAASSGSFDLFSSGDFIFTGSSTASSFLGNFGFLYFPFVTEPTLTATAGNAEVDLSWTAASAGLGFDVSGYEYGVSSTSGSGYAYFNVGNVTSTTATGLTNGTTYYFVIRVLDTFGNPIAVSGEASATPTDGTVPAPAGSGSTFMGVRFIGEAYPGAVVSVLKDAVLRATTVANAFGQFTLTLQEEYDENVLYTLYADDADGRRSLLLNYPFVGEESAVREIDGIKFAPTIAADKVATKRGEPVSVSGFALPHEQIEFLLAGPVSRTLTAASGAFGRYALLIASGDLPPGDYQLRAHYPADSRYTLTIRFSVGEANVLPAPVRDDLPGDCNADGAITLRDFSVLAYWYGKESPPSCIDANADGRVNLVDFSILAYYWSG